MNQVKHRCSLNERARGSRRGLTVFLLLISAAWSLTAAAPNTPVAPAIPNFSPGSEYADSARMFQGIPGIERAANGRLWATWYGGGVTEDDHNYILLYTSGDDGASLQRVLVLDPDGSGPAEPEPFGVYD